MKISYPVFKSLLALSLGTLGVCMSEFSMMGILPAIATSLEVSIPTAGHYISAYALGVCVGAPATVLVARTKPLRSILIGLMLLYIIGNTFTALAPNSLCMIVARFIAGLPHGSYFGVASIVADKLAGRAYSVLAVSIVITGATIANLAGVPCSTLLTSLVSWRIAYALIAAIGFLVILGVLLFVPVLPGLKDRGLKGQFLFLLRPGPWVVLFAIVFGNGGMFCWYSYVSPFMTTISGVPMLHMTAVMALAGLGMVLGNLLSGRLSMRFSAQAIAAGMQGVMCFALLGLFFLGSSMLFALALMTICTACLFGISAPQQMLLLRNAKGGEMLGAALAQVGFNAGNALGAFGGGLVIDAGLGYSTVALSGSVIACVGFLLLVVYAKFFAQRHRKARV